MDKKKVLTYFLLGFSTTILLIGTALIIVGSIALNDSKNCSKKNDNILSTPENSLSTTPSTTSTNSTSPPGGVNNYFIRINIKITSTNKLYGKYDAQTQGQEVLLKVRNILSSTSESRILSILSIDNDCMVPFLNNYNVIILLVYFEDSPSLNDISNLLISNNVKVLETKNLVDGYIPLTAKDETCKSFCDLSCSGSTTVSPMTTTTTANILPFTTPSNVSSITTTTTNALPFTTPSNVSSITTTTTNALPFTTPSNVSSVTTTTTNGLPFTTPSNVSSITTTTTDALPFTTPNNVSSLTTTTSYTPTNIPSCSTILAVDSSDYLESYYYQSELQAIKSFSSVIPHFDDVLIASYNNITKVVKPFNSMASTNDFENAIGNINQEYGSRLSILLSTLLNTLKNRQNQIINTVIMITEKVPDEINKSKSLVGQLKSMGSISFIIVGTGVKEEDLKPLNPTNIFVYDFASCDINELIFNFKNFTTCQSKPYFYDELDTSSEYPCKSSIIFSLDSSVALNKDKFEAEIDGLTSNEVITDEWNNFERISLVKYYTSTDIVFNFNFAQTRDTFFKMVKTIQQTGNSINFANLLSALESGFFFYPSNEVQNHFIFLSNDITTNDIQISIPYANSLKKKGSLNLIVLGKNIIPRLNYLTSGDRILYLDYTTNDNKEVLKNFIESRMMCN